MCLDYLENYPVNQQHGWQIFRQSDGYLRSWFRGGSLQPNSLQEANQIKIYTYDETATYMSGFHIFIDYDECKEVYDYCVTIQPDLIIRRVLFSNILHKGRQLFTITDYTTDYTRVLYKVIVTQYRFVTVMDY